MHRHTISNVFFFFFSGDIFRSPSDVDTLGRASVLRDGTAFRPASAPHPLLENHFYQPFIYPSETPAHPHTAPHTPTELEQELERARSEERSNCDLKESVAEGQPFFKQFIPNISLSIVVVNTKRGGKERRSIENFEFSTD